MTADVHVQADSGHSPSANLPFSVVLELTVKDPDLIAELSQYAEGDERDQFALTALRIGLLALRQARGQLDGEVVRRESERLLDNLQSRLGEHATVIHERITTTLREYFDPQSGRFQERVNRLVKQDGELEQVLRRQVGGQDSELCKTLTAHIGDESPLMKLLGPEQSQGLLAALRVTLEDQLRHQREQVLGQFSLDNKSGALSRFIAELNMQHGKLSADLSNKIDTVVQEFSLDQEDSALSRLVRNVDHAQRTITSEFSLDEETSALSRLKRMLESTNEAIHAHLSLDDDKSALARLKRELLTLLGEQRDTNQKFQEEVKSALQAMTARREEAERSTRHGLEFEDALVAWLRHAAQQLGDIATHTGHTTGIIKNCKVGDCLIELGPDHAAAGARIAVEAKEKAGYDLAQARAEIETARKNRQAQIGLFVFSSKLAPAGLEPVTRYGHDVFVVWDSEDLSSDLFLRVGLTLARALGTREHHRTESQHADFSAIDAAILEIEKRTASLGDIETWATTIQKRSEDILKKTTASRKSLLKQVELLREKTDDLRQTIDESADA